MLVVKTTSPATSPSPAKLHPSKTAPSSRTTVARLRLYTKLRSKAIVDQLSSNYSTHYPARQPPPEVGGVRRSAHERLPAHRPLLREVNERQVRRTPNHDTSSLADPPSRRTAHRLDEPRKRDRTSHNQLRVERRKGSLVAQETRRGLLEGQLLFLRGVRRVVRRHEVQHAVAQRIGYAVTIILRPEGRVHPEQPVERGDEPVRQREVMRGGVRAYVRPALEETDKRRRSRGRHVSNGYLRP